MTKGEKEKNYNCRQKDIVEMEGERKRKVQTEGERQEDREVERQTEKIERGRLVEREKGYSGKRKERQRLLFRHREI